jgi:hypothetical protein
LTRPSTSSIHSTRTPTRKLHPRLWFNNKRLPASTKPPTARTLSPVKIPTTTAPASDDPSQSQSSSHAQAVFNMAPSSLYQAGEPSRFQEYSEVSAHAQSSFPNLSSRVNPSKKPAVPKKKTSTPNKRIARKESSSTAKTYFNSPLKKLEPLKLDKRIEIPKGSERLNWCRCK